MQQSKIEIRAIHTDYPKGDKRVRVSVRCVKEKCYNTFEIPAHLPVTRNNVLIYVKEKYPDYKIGKIPTWLKQ